MKYFGIKANLIGVRTCMDERATTRPELKEPVPIFEGKVECIKQFIHPTERPILGIGDSMNDCPMLEYSHLRAVVDRGNELAAKAKTNTWCIL